MPDNLTLEFKRQLDERTKTALARPTTLPSLTSQAGGGPSLWESARGKELPSWMSEGIQDEETSLLTAIGKGAWTALDITLLGTPGLVGRAIDPEWTKSMEPQTFGERVAAGIGGAAGFLGPMSVARSIASAGVKAFAGAGVKKFSQKFADDAVRIMRGDKETVNWARKKLQRRGEEFNDNAVTKFLHSIIDEPKAKLLTLGKREGERIFMRTAKNRVQFAKNFNDNLPTVLMEKLAAEGFTGRNAANIVNTLGDDVALKIGTLVDDAGGVFKFPVTQLHGVLAGWMGNAKLGNAAAAAVEEAILFSAVELPLNYMSSLNNEDVDFSFTGTLGHAWLLGSALGLIRFIPGGKEQGLIRPAWNKMTKSLSTRRRYADYDPTNAADRLLLREDAKRIFDMKKKPFKRLKKTVKEYKGSTYQVPISRKTDFDKEKFYQTEEGAKQLKGVLMDIEKALYKSWWPKFLKEIPEDLFKSSPRMLAGALAFNFSGIQDMAQTGYPWEDIIFNVALGMFMSKKGKSFEYVNSRNGRIEHLFDDKPYTFTKELGDVDKWLDMTNTGLDASLFRIIYNEQLQLKNGFAGPDTNKRDMQKLKEIAEAEGLIVKKYVGEDEEGNRITREKKPAEYSRKVTDADGKTITERGEQDATFEDEVYSTFAGIIDINLKPKDAEYDVLEAYELSPEKLKSVKDRLAKEEFDALEEMSTDGFKGIRRSKDLVSVVTGASSAESVQVRKIYEKAVIAIYNKVFDYIYKGKEKPLQHFDDDLFDTDGRVKLPPLDFTDTNLDIHPRVTRIIGEKDNELMKILAPQASVDGRVIRLNQRMIDDIFGTYENGRVAKKGLIHEFDDMLTKLIFNEEPNTIPDNRKLEVGNDLIGNWVSIVLNHRTVKQHWRGMTDLAVGSTSSRIFDKETMDKIKVLLPEVFNSGSMLADNVKIKGTSSENNPNEYSFVNSLLGVLHTDLSRSTGTVPTVKEANISDVKELMKIFDDKMPIFTMAPSASKTDLIVQLKEFTTDRALANLTKSVRGKAVPLDGVDRIKTKLMIEEKMLTPKMTMLNITGVFDNITKMYNFFNENRGDLEKIDDIKTWLSLIQKDKSMFYEVSSGMGNSKFLSEIFGAAEMSGTDPGVFIAEFYDKYKKHITPYLIESGKKGGFITIDPSAAAEAQVSAVWLAELGLKLDLLDTGIQKVTHDQLFEVIIPEMRRGKYGFSQKVDGEIHSMLGNVLNLYLSRPSTAPLAIRALSEAGLYDQLENRLKFDDFKEDTVLDHLQAAKDAMNTVFQVFGSHRDLEVIWEKDRLDGESKFPVDNHLTMSLDKYLKKYNIKINLAPGNSLSKAIKDDPDAMKNAINFYDFMKKSGAELVYNGKKVPVQRWGLKQYNAKHDEFLEKTFMAYYQIKNAITVNKIKVNGENPNYVQETFQKNALYDMVNDLIGEYTLVDKGDFQVDGRKNNIALARDEKLRIKFFNMLASKAPFSVQGIGTSEQAMKDAGDAGAKVPYTVAFLSTMSDGIGIPMGGINGKYTAVNKIVKEFIRVVDKRIKEFGPKGTNVISPNAIKTYESFKKSSLNSEVVEIEKPDGKKTKITEWTYKEGDSDHQRVSREMTMMLTNIFGDKVMGDEYWKAIHGTTFEDGDLFAKTQLRYMKLLFNRSAKRLTTDIIDEAVSLIERKNKQGNPMFDFLGIDVVGETDSIKAKLKSLSKDGIAAHILGDESPISGQPPPPITSLFASLAKQVEAEQTASGIRDFQDYNIDTKSMPGGNIDVSRFDSINVISRDMMEAIRFLAGLHSSRVEHMKPVGGLASDASGVFLDKTAWVTDRAWDDYLARNEIDMVIMDSSAKMAGTDIIGEKGADEKHSKIIYMDEFNSLGELMGSKMSERFVDIDKIIKLPIDTFSLASAVTPKKEATIPLQVASDLIDPGLNQDFYRWMLEDGVREFIKDADKMFAEGGDAHIAGTLKLDMDELDIATDQMSLLEKWIRSGGDPTFLPFKRTVRNTLKRQLINNRNLFSPRNKHGGQGIVVSDFHDYGDPGYLRNSIFQTVWREQADRNSTADIKDRNIWTYGQIELDGSNKSKLVATDRVRFIMHNESSRDGIVTVNEIPNNKRIKSLLDKGVVQLGDLHKALEGTEIVYRVMEGVDFYEHRTLRSPDGDPRDIWIVDSKESAENQLQEMQDRASGRGENFWFADSLVDIKEKGKLVGWKLKDNRLIEGKKRGDDKYIYLKKDAPSNIKADELRQRGMEYYGKEGEQGIQTEETRYEVAVVAHRTPTTRVSDKVIVGLKGFGDITGNAVKINHADGWFRLEMDFDLDKLNYWWDTPDGILKFWDEKSGKVPSVKADQERKNIKGLNPFNGEALVNYNYGEAQSSVLRGVVAKAKNTIQYLKYYRGYYDEVPGFSMTTDRGRIVMQADHVIEQVEERLAGDIQRIIDAQGRGYDNTLFDKGWEQKILFGSEGTNEKQYYPGLFVKQHSVRQSDGTDLWQDTGKLNDMEIDIISTAIRPYKRLLQLRTNIFEDGEQKKIDYDTMLDYTRQYRYTMDNLSKYVYWTLRKGRGVKGVKYSEEKLNPYFKKGGEFIDPIKLEDARFERPETDAVRQNEKMIAADRMAGNLAGWDRLTGKKIDPKTQNSVDDFVMQFFMGDTKNISEATKTVLNMFKSDFKKLDALNSIDYRMRRYRRAQRRMEYYSNHDMADHYKNRHETLGFLRDSINSEIMMNKKVARTVRAKVIKQITENLMYGGTWIDKFDKKHNFGYITNLQDRRAKIAGIKSQIEASVFDYKNQKLAVNIRGVNTDDYAQILSVYNVMSEITSIALDPAVMGQENAWQFTKDIGDFRRSYTDKWYKFLNHKSTDDMDQNSIMNTALIELEQLYYNWEKIKPGLGRHLVLSIMTPRIANDVVTYHKGWIMPGFRKAHTQSKFITVGLRFLDRLDSSFSLELMGQIAKPISNQLAWMRGEASPHYQLEGIDQKNMRALDIGDAEGGSPLIKYENPQAFHKKLSDLATKSAGLDSIPTDLNELAEFQLVNEEILNILGLTGDMALDYIAYKLPSGGLDLIGSLSALVEFKRLPTNALTRSGKMVPVGGANSFFRHKMNQVRMFFGSDTKNMFTNKRTPVQGEIYGTPDYATTNNPALSMKKRTGRYIIEDGKC